MIPAVAQERGLLNKKYSSPMPLNGTRSAWRKGLRLPLITNPCRGFGSHTGIVAVLTVLALFLPLFPPSGLQAQGPLKVYETRNAAISYAEEKDLHTFIRNIGSGLSFFRENPEQNPLLVKNQVDKIVETIGTLLDMHPPDLRFGITLHRTQAAVSAAYRAEGMMGTAPIAFYSHRTRKITVAIDSVTEGVLAHEIAHAIISAYFVTPPPARMQEILAQYIDKYFRDR